MPSEISIDLLIYGVGSYLSNKRRKTQNQFDRNPLGRTLIFAKRCESTHRPMAFSLFDLRLDSIRSTAASAELLPKLRISGEVLGNFTAIMTELRVNNLRAIPRMKSTAKLSPAVR